MDQQELKQQLKKEAMENKPEDWGYICLNFLGTMEAEDYFGL